MISVIRKTILEVAIILMIVVFLVLNLILATASIFLVVLPASRKKLKDQWQSFGSTWKRIRRHYRYLWLVLTWREPTPEDEVVPETESQESRKREEEHDARSLFFALIHVPQVILVVAILLNVIYVALFTEFTYRSPVVERTGSEQPAKKPEFIPTDADKQEAELCPCTPRYELPVEAEDLSYLNIALIDETGETKFSNRFKYEFDDKVFFTLAGDPKVKNESVGENGTVRFTSSGNEIVLNPGQAFQFLNSPFLTYMIDKNGTAWAAKTAELTPVPFGR